MKKILVIVTLCAVSLTLQAQSQSGNAVSTPLTQVQQQQELAKTQRRLAELQAGLVQTQKSSAQVGRNTRSSGISRPSQGRRTTVVSSPYHSWMGSAPQSGVALVVPAPGAGAEDILNVQDDLQVMSRLFQKQLEQAGVAPPKRDAYYMVYNMVGSSLGHNLVSGVQSLYLAGYGVVFQLKVEFPLVAQAQDQGHQTDSQEDSLWAQTRLELQDPEAARRAKEKGKQDVPTYDPQKVEDLKETLIKTLKYTRNIRSLQPNEKAVIVVTSTAEIGPSTPMPHYTTLALSAGKADIDQFAGGGLDYQQFQGKVQSMMY